MIFYGQFKHSYNLYKKNFFDYIKRTNNNEWDLKDNTYESSYIATMFLWNYIPSKVGKTQFVFDKFVTFSYLLNISVIENWFSIDKQRVIFPVDFHKQRNVVNVNELSFW